MKKTMWMTLATVGVAVSAWAQSGGAVIVHKTVPHLESPQVQVSEYQHMTVQGKITRGAPYSADTLTESVQTLADGNRIVRRTATRIYRDSEGRTRTERLSDLGVVIGISISDPVSGETLMLNPETRTAYRGGVITIKTSAGGLITLSEGQPGLALKIEEKALDAAKRQQMEDQARLTAGGGGTLVVTRESTAAQALGEAKRQQEMVEQARLAAAGVSHVAEGAGRTKVTNEDLGQQTVEGVLATGKRTTTEIEAGVIGNERPIRSVSEQWFSPDLQTLVLTRHSDPRTGETTFRLTNIVRGEPDRSLFLLPPGYTLKESAIRRESR